MRRHSRYDKKGSLELSVNAIVVLVMAIAVLGLGLAFIRGALTKAQTNVFKAIDNAQLENPASADHPATADKNTQVKQSSSAQISLGFYNTYASSVTVSPTIESDTGCIQAGDTTPTANAFTISSGSQEVGPGTATGFQGYLTATGGASAGKSYVCTVEFKDGTDVKASTQLFISVVS